MIGIPSKNIQLSDQEIIDKYGLDPVEDNQEEYVSNEQKNTQINNTHPEDQAIIDKYGLDPIEDEQSQQPQPAQPAAYEENTGGLGFKRAAGLVSRGLMRGVTGIADFATTLGNAVSNDALYEAGIGEDRGINRLDEVGKESDTGYFLNKGDAAVNSVFGEDLTPNGWAENTISGAGEVLTPIPTPAKAKLLASGAKNVAKKIATSSAQALGVSSVLNHETPSIVSEDGFWRETEKMLEAGLASAKSKGAANYLMGIKKDIPVIEAKVAQKISEINSLPIYRKTKTPKFIENYLAKTFAEYGSPNLNYHKVAKNLVGEVTYGDIGGNLSKHIEDKFLKGILVDKTFNEIKNSRGSKTIKNLEDMLYENIRSLDAKNALQDPKNSGLASSMFFDALSAENESIKNTKRYLYKNVDDIFESKGAPIPDSAPEFLSATKDVLKKAALSKSKFSNDVTNELFGELKNISQNKKYQEIIRSVQDGIKKLPPAATRDQVVEVIGGIDEAFKSANGFDVERLWNLKKNLRAHKKASNEGTFKEMFAALHGSIAKDVSMSKNKEFRNALSLADAYYQTDYIGRMKTSLAKSILTGKPDEVAFNATATSGGIDRLFKIIGKDPSSNVVMENLLEARLRKTLTDSLDIDKVKINTTTLLSKAVNEKELITKIVGKQKYQMFLDGVSALDELKRNKRFFGEGSSGTAQAISDIAASGALTSSPVLGFYGFVPGLFYFSSKRLVSNLFANQRFVDKVVELNKILKSDGYEKKKPLVMRVIKKLDKIGQDWHVNKYLILKGGRTFTDYKNKQRSDGDQQKVRNIL